MRRLNLLMFWFYIKVALRSLKNPTLGHLLLTDHLVMNKMRDAEETRQSVVNTVASAYDEFRESSLSTPKLLVEVRS